MKKIIKLLLVILWMILIFLLSNQNATSSGNLSKNFVDKTIINVYKVFNKNVTKNDIENIINKVITPVRKVAHFMIYLVLGILAINYLREYNNKYLIVYSILICLLYAISDEIHQIYIPGRSGEIRDVMIDTFGSILGIVSYYYSIIRKRVRNK